MRSLSSRAMKHRRRNHVIVAAGTFLIMSVCTLLSIKDLHNRVIPLPLPLVSPKLELHNADVEENSTKWHEIGEYFFVRTQNESNQTIPSARDLCDKLDTSLDLKALKHWKTLSIHERARRFTDCVDELERSQQEFRNMLPHFESRTCRQNNSDQQELIHAMWDMPVNSTNKLPKTALLSMLSFVSVYPRGCVTLHLWVINDRTENILKSELAEHLHEDTFVVHRLNFSDLCTRILKYHPTLHDKFEKKRSLLNRMIHGENSVVQSSDIVRMYILAAYGGVYLDCDVVLLRPLTPLLARDFYYRWSSQLYGNTAALHMQLGSHNAGIIIEKGLEANNAKIMSYMYHPRRLYPMLLETNASIELLPSAYFDAFWTMLDTKYSEAQMVSAERYGISTFLGDFFLLRNNNTKVIENARKNFLSGVFAFHFHNQWSADFVEGSTADLLLKALMYQKRKTL